MSIYMRTIRIVFFEIIVPPSTVPISYRGSYHYRSGSTKQELKGSALQEFLFKKMGKTWDDMVVENASWQDIDENAVKSFLKKAVETKRITSDAAKDDTKTLLRNLQLVNDKEKLKNAALLLFGKNTQKYFITAYFKIGRFRKSDADQRFQDVIEGNILEMADKVIEVLRGKYLVSPIRLKDCSE
jgi:ATP-dependent DNA helicase RecG